MTALRSELNDRALADAVYAVQEELKAILTEGPVSASDADSAAFKERVNGRRAGTQSLIEDIGAAYRSL